MVAGNKNVIVGTASTLRQCLNARLLDEIHIDLAPVVLGGGTRLFDQLKAVPVHLELLTAVQGTGVTHVSFRVV